MSGKRKIIDQLMRLSTWAMEAAFAIEDDEDAGMSRLESELDWLDDLGEALDEAVFAYSGMPPKAKRIVHDAPARIQ